MAIDTPTSPMSPLSSSTELDSDEGAMYLNGASHSSDPDDEHFTLDLDDSSDESTPVSEAGTDAASTFDKASIAELVAQYGSSSATAWLEFSRYKIWQAPAPMGGSSFPPVQGFMRQGPWIFAWGNPLVSTPAALEATARAFVQYAAGARVVWACVDHAMEEVLGEKLGWSTVHCIYEDVVDPRRVIEVVEAPEKKTKRLVTNAKGKEDREHDEIVRDLKKNLRRAEKANISIEEAHGDLKEADREAIEKGVADWRKHRHGLQIASTTLQPWLDQEHRRYWIARDAKGKPIGILILTPVHNHLHSDHKHDDSIPHPEHPEHPSHSFKHPEHAPCVAYQIKNAVSFPDAPKGTSEKLIYSMLCDLDAEQNRRDKAGEKHDRITVTFGISAADKMSATHHLGGWKVTALSKTYAKIAKATGLINRLEFRRKFESIHEPMFVCYPEDGFGLDGVKALLRALKK
ncbi:hypothetical protein EV122DRAFT_252875 [Schizophyllum commune]